MSKTVVLVVLAACGTTTYSYQYKRTQQFAGGEEPEPAPREARELLANARTVAFYPPDYCVNVDMSSSKSQEMHDECGTLMSALERAASDAGYEVLSWQNLKGPGKRPLDFARESNVDVLFEVNALEAAVLDDTTVKHVLSFYEGDGPLDVSTSLAETCRDYAFKADPPKGAALSGRVDIKTVAVADGRDRWLYRKTEQREIERAYPRVSFAAQNHPDALTRTLLTVGAVGMGIGAGLWLSEVSTTDDPSTAVNEKFDSGGWSTNLMVVGGAATLAALAVGIGGGGTKPPVNDTLCNGKFAVVTEGPRRVDVMSSQHTFEQTQQGDSLREARRQVIAHMTQQFIDEIKAAKRSRPPAPTPAAPPPAAVPAPASASPAPVPAPPAAPPPAHP